MSQLPYDRAPAPKAIIGLEEVQLAHRDQVPVWWRQQVEWRMRPLMIGELPAEVRRNIAEPES